MTSLSVSNRLASHGNTIRQLASFGAIGVASTVAYVVLYAWLRDATPAGIANALALVITAVGNTAANRWLTFGIRGNAGLARDHAAGLLAFGAALVITSASLVVLSSVMPGHSRTVEIAVLVFANAVATLVRFVLLRLAMNRDRDARMAASSPALTVTHSGHDGDRYRETRREFS
jgi:putative flippase GtrA